MILDIILSVFFGTVGFITGFILYILFFKPPPNDEDDMPDLIPISELHKIKEE